MTGRKGKPISLHLFNGNPSHLTKAEIKERQESEIRLGTSDYKMPPEVRALPAARKKWKELEDIYRGSELVSSSDVGTMAQLCIAYAELSDLLKYLHTIDDIKLPSDEEHDLAEMLGDELRPRQLVKLLDKINYILSVGGVLQVHKAIDAKRTQIRALEDRLFLNPLAKIRNIPKKPAKEKEASPLEQAGFGNV